MAPLAVIWRAAGLCFATSTDAVVEVLPPLAWRPVPAVPAWVRGLFSHRGRLTPLVDTAGLLGLQVPPDRMSNRVIVARCAADAGEDPVARHAPSLAASWGDPDETRTIRWPLFLHLRQKA